MKITKFGHCCLLIEEKGVRILTDPGNFSTEQDNVKNIDLVLITHEHGDHCHIDSLKKVLKNSPKAKIVTNKGVGILLDKENIVYEIVENGQSHTFKDVLIEAFGEDHAVIYPALPPIVNIGYFINDKLFYPGDSFVDPGKSVDILALPVSGPWMKLSEAIDYAKKIKPNKCFPVHDGALKIFGATHRLPTTFLEEAGIKFMVLDIGKEIEL